MNKHEHIQAFLMYEIIFKLEEIHRCGVGFIDQTFTKGVDYRIDDTVYRITIEEVYPDD